MLITLSLLQGLVTVISVTILAVNWVDYILSQVEGTGELVQTGPVTELKLISGETRITSQFPQHEGPAE
jgi:hypothetical protein